MLVATPYINFEGVRTSDGPPRVISEIRKSSPVHPKEQIRPRISGDLLVMCGNDKRWWPRRVMVRGGQLLIGSAPHEAISGSLRIPLRHLSLAAGPLPNSLALYRGQTITITLQTANERAFDLWVKTIAIELIRQTPLDAVKYLDILTLTECWNRKNQEYCDKDWNFNCLKEITKTQCDVCATNESSPSGPSSMPISICKGFNENNNIINKSKTSAGNNITNVVNGKISEDVVDGPVMKTQNDEKAVEVILKKCQNSDNYVPVREKLLLFESLCRLGRKVRSTEDVSLKKLVDSSQRTRSMHDLTNCPSSIIGVRQICKYFETKTDEQDSKQFATIFRTNKRLINSDTQLNSVKPVYKFNRNLQNVSYA